MAKHVVTEYSGASNIKSKQTQTNAQDALVSIKDQLRYYRNFPPDDGIAMFSGAVDASGGQTAMVVKVLENPLEPIQSFRYYCDSNSLTGPLEDMLMDKGLFGLITPDRREANVGQLKSKRVEPVKSAPPLVPGKQRKGGQSAQHSARPRLETIDNFYQEAAGVTNDLFVLRRHDMDGALAGDLPPTKDGFLDDDYLHHELQGFVVREFDVAYTGESSSYDLVGIGQDALADQEVIKDKKQMEEFFEKLHCGNESTYGFEATRRNFVIGSADRLLISEGLRKDIAVYGCSDQEEYELVDHRHDTPTHERGDNSEAEPKDREDAIEWFMDLAGQRGTETKPISTDFEKDEQLHNAFGGIAGILRYSIGV